MSRPRFHREIDWVGCADGQSSSTRFVRSIVTFPAIFARLPLLLPLRTVRSIAPHRCRSGRRKERPMKRPVVLLVDPHPSDHHIIPPHLQQPRDPLIDLARKPFGPNFVTLGKPEKPDRHWKCNTDLVWPVLAVNGITLNRRKRAPYVCRHMFYGGE
jgi:hypothetical protein